MTTERNGWADAKRRLTSAVTSLGYPAELADLLARQLQSPRAMNRMASYLKNARPQSVEMIADEMLAICADVSAWREKKESEGAQAVYSAWLNSGQRLRNLEEEEEET